MNTLRRAAPLIVMMVLAGCAGKEPDPEAARAVYNSYRDIPGVTREEIVAIETLRFRDKPFVYGTITSKESFLPEDGDIKGYTALFCDWLTELFAIPFEPRICDWDEMNAGLESLEIDFTDEIPHEPEYRKIYYMTDPIADRIMKRISIRGAGTNAAARENRAPRYGFLENSPAQDLVLSWLNGPFDILSAKNYVDAYEMLSAGDIDVFFENEAVEAVFEFYDDVVMTNFYPVIHVPVSLSTRNPELRPIISVVEKYIESGGTHYLTGLYNRGNAEYVRYRLLRSLTEEELEYLAARHGEDAKIATGTRYDNYPISFYNENEGEWQGIAVDVLNEIEALTGLQFRTANGETEEWFTIADMLEAGELSMVGYYGWSPDEEDRFIWAEDPYRRDYYALISKTAYPDINFIEVPYNRVGVISNSIYLDVLDTLFPNHPAKKEYATVSDELDALERGEVDLILSSADCLLMLTNYLEHPGYKINLLLDNRRETTFCFNKNEVLLRSIVSKAQRFVNTEKIIDNWSHRVFDYRSTIARLQVPYLIGLSAMLAAILVLLFVMQIRSRQEGKRLEAVVHERTAELEVQTDRANSASRAKSQFLASMSHEIRTPMNAIIGLSDLMRTDNLDELQIGYFTDIKKMAKSLLHIINDILDFSKIEAGKLELIPVHFNMPGLFDNICSMSQFTAMAKDLDFRHHFDSNIPEVLYGDEIRLRQVITNLVNNAIKYTHTGSVSLDLGREQRGDKDFLIVIVKDTGIGIKKEHFSKLFGVFQQLDSEKNRRIVGTGLGLSITKNLVEMMGGGISFESEYGKGSTFTVTLPLVPGDPEKIERKDATAQVIAVEDVNVLVIDDNSINLTVAKGFLATHNIIPDTAASGREALEMIDEKYYDLVFMDHMMPDMDGIETTKHIRNLEKPWFQKLPIVALSANAVTGAREAFIEAGMNDFISKPIDAKELNLMLLKWLPSGKITTRKSEVRESNTEFEDLFKELGKITDLDMEAGLSHMADNRTVYIQILRQFCKELDRYLDDINTFLAAENWKEYTIKIHAMKGVFANMGVSSLAKWAYDLEFASKNNDYEKCVKQTESLCASMFNFREKLLETSLMETTGAAKKHDATGSELLAILEALDAACKAGESGKADALAEELKAASFNGAADALSAEIYDLVASLDYDQVLEKSAGLRGVISGYRGMRKEEGGMRRVGCREIWFMNE
jgi:signal transduction histidine kinase/response regulator of citrate/malate metabolism/ABC-type amino acid transport substrate-binding protein